jgi:Protein of unknown function (DUF3800)
VFHCYFDDSGKESEPTNRFVVIAGYLAVDIVWDRLEHVWSHLLIKHGLSHVHMKDILGVAKAKGWDIPKLNSVLADFIRAIKAAPGLIGFGVAVDADEWRKLSPERRKRFGDAQEFACSRIVRRVRDRLIEAGHERELLGIFFDQDFEFARRRITLIEELRKRSPDLRNALAQVTFADAELFYPLQAADLLAWETRRHLINRVGGKLNTARWAELMAALPHGEFEYAAGEYWDKALIDSELPKVEAANDALASSSKGQPS